MAEGNEAGLNESTTAPSAANEIEARFLRNQKARTVGISNSSKHRKDELFNFWAEVREQLSQWQSRLSNRKLLPVTSDRHQAMNDLDQMLIEIKILQKNALAAEVMLTATDIKLLHEEFATCRSHLEEVREIICPSTRFVFKKYRSALRKRGTRKAGIGDTSVARTEPKYLELGRSVQDFSESDIYEEEDGSFTIKSKGNISTLQRKIRISTSLVLQNLRDCKVFLITDCQLLHISSVNNCTINIDKRVDGAIHVTSCNDSSIYGASHQLRIHESAGLEFHVHVDTGPILEESTNICFFAGLGDNILCEAKDFEWFRSDKPSPNFRIVEEPVHPSIDVIRNNSCPNLDLCGEATPGIQDNSDDDEL